MANSVSTSGDSTDIRVDQGSNFDHTLTLTTNGTPLNLSGYLIRMQVRRTFGAMTTEINATQANGKLLITNAAGGVVSIALVPADTSSIRFNDRDDSELECVYDVEIESPAGKVYKPMKGTFTLTREVTR